MTQPVPFPLPMGRVGFSPAWGPRDSVVAFGTCAQSRYGIGLFRLADGRGTLLIERAQEHTHCPQISRVDAWRAWHEERAQGVTNLHSWTRFRHRRRSFQRIRSAILALPCTPQWSAPQRMPKKDPARGRYTANRVCVQQKLMAPSCVLLFPAAGSFRCWQRMLRESP